MKSFPVNRFIVAFRLLAILPTAPTDAWTVKEIYEELGVSERTFFRIVNALRKAGFVIKKSTRPNGRKSYYIGRPAQEFIDRILSAGV